MVSFCAEMQEVAVSVAGHQVPLLPTKHIFRDGTPLSEYPTILPSLVDLCVKWLCVSDPSKLICFLPAYSGDKISRDFGLTYNEMRSSAMVILEKLEVVVSTYGVSSPLGFTVTGSRDPSPCMTFSSSTFDVLVAAKTEAEVHHALLAIVAAIFREWAHMWHTYNLHPSASEDGGYVVAQHKGKKDYREIAELGLFGTLVNLVQVNTGDGRERMTWRLSPAFGDVGQHLILKDESVKRVLLGILSHDIPFGSQTRPFFDIAKDAVLLNSNELHEMIEASLISPLATPLPALPSCLSKVDRQADTITHGPSADIKLKNNGQRVTPHARFTPSHHNPQDASSSSSTLPKSSQSTLTSAKPLMSYQEWLDYDTYERTPPPRITNPLHFYQCWCPDAGEIIYPG